VKGGSDMGETWKEIYARKISNISFSEEQIKGLVRTVVTDLNETLLKEKSPHSIKIKEDFTLELPDGIISIIPEKKHLNIKKLFTAGHVERELNLKINDRGYYVIVENEKAYFNFNLELFEDMIAYILLGNQ
jgi:hypothetical protein